MTMVQTVQVAVLGATGVGKTSIIRQFVAQEFREEYTPTESRQLYRASAVLSERMYELLILDLPKLPRYPGSAGQVRIAILLYSLNTCTFGQEVLFLTVK